MLWQSAGRAAWRPGPLSAGEAPSSSRTGQQRAPGQRELVPGSAAGSVSLRSSMASSSVRAESASNSSTWVVERLGLPPLLHPAGLGRGDDVRVSRASSSSRSGPVLGVSAFHHVSCDRGQRARAPSCGSTSQPRTRRNPRPTDSNLPGRDLVEPASRDSFVRVAVHPALRAAGRGDLILGHQRGHWPKCRGSSSSCIQTLDGQGSRWARQPVHRLAGAVRVGCPSRSFRPPSVGVARATVLAEHAGPGPRRAQHVHVAVADLAPPVAVAFRRSRRRRRPAAALGASTAGRSRPVYAARGG